MKHTKAILLSLLLAIGIFSTPSVEATSITYQLFDSKYGAIRPPTYGLRLDGLKGEPNHEYTFSFEAKGASMKMTVTDNPSGHDTARIYGTVYGGRDIGGEWEDSGLYKVEFLYPRIKLKSGGTFVSKGERGIGTISGGGVKYSLVDFKGGHSRSFYFDFTDPKGKKGKYPAGTYFADGWLKHSGKDHVKASDWLFTARRVPDQGNTVLLMSFALLCLLVCTKRKFLQCQAE